MSQGEALTNLREIVDAFLAAYPDWTVIATDEAANYGAGLCADASADLVAFAGARGIHGAVAWFGSFLPFDAVPSGYAISDHEGHAVALFGDEVADLTARQFGPALPFPYFWTVSECVVDDSGAIDEAPGLTMMTMEEQLDAADTIGRRMRFARGCAGLSMGDVSRGLGLTVPQVSAAERGDGAGLQAGYARLCGVSLRWLETGERTDAPAPREAPEDPASARQVDPAATTCSWCERVHDGGPEKCMAGPVIVCGGRNYGDYDRVRAVLDRLARRVEIFAIRHGAARGADSLGGRWARENGYLEQVYPAEWDRLGKRAGFVRNQEMIDDHNPEIPSSRVVAVVAFPGGNGTAHMVRIARAAGVPVWELHD
jgi:transcriptional regulator with XRE-family HTH domain